MTFVRSLETDLARRDFTVNAMAYHPDRGVVDPFGGRRDLKKGFIRCVGVPEQRFQEDGLRILRALRFAARYGFSIEGETARAMEQCRALLDCIAVERIFQELKGFFCGRFVRTLLLEHRDIFAQCLPELRSTFGFDQRNRNHCCDVWEHTVWAVENIAPDPVRGWPCSFMTWGNQPVLLWTRRGRDTATATAPVSACIAAEALTDCAVTERPCGM